MANPTFHHRPDGTLILADGDAELILPLAWFIQQEPDYALDPSANRRLYIQGDRHALFNDESQWGGEMPWVEGDRYLGNLAAYASAWALHQQGDDVPAGEALAIAKALKLKQLEESCQSLIMGGFVSTALGDSYTYSSQREDQINLIGATLAGFSVVIAELRQAINGLADLLPEETEGLADVKTALGQIGNYFPIAYVCRSGDLHTTRYHTPNQILQVFGDGVRVKSSLIHQFHLLRQEVEAGETIEAVEAIQWVNPTT